ncbi:putative pyridoxal phosphate binding protein [Thermochaetoides thermophila DSM 1495]|uniref:Putative pyridoxal phosphate binding protein n=1 Tax=Chaetomium thermophilum (strain DSM 1495 / CBS 144.50 / IMI 039719) TaxID=759272 RepID=G0S3Y4_CHATD|nr:putative pyridoxal phosphate binding protein [Thermochaetoides thermophila DSM 1495]EGS22046.1 putative pyridoxal phosphate binding protein [Thermochaetoides thermophila DSM 1495]
MTEIRPSSQFKNEHQPTKTKHLINLLRGWPAPSLLPTHLIQAKANEVLSDPAIAISALQYAPDPGYQPLREALAEYLCKVYPSLDEFESAGQPRTFSSSEEECSASIKDVWEAENFAITGGASQSIACVLQSFTDPGYTRGIIISAPCYFLGCPIFEDAGFVGRLYAVREDKEDGMDLERLRWLLEGEDGRGSGDFVGEVRYKNPGKDRKIYRYVIYLVATSANPSGKTMSVEKRRRMVELARKHDALIISDDVYDFLQWTTADKISATNMKQRNIRPLPTLSQIDIALGRSPHDPPGKHFGHAISNASFSKLAGPGMRTGWIHGTKDFVHGFSVTGTNRSGGAASQFAAAILAKMLQSGELPAWIDGVVKPALQERYQLIMKAIKEELPDIVEVWNGNGPNGVSGDVSVFGGYFVWLTFPETIDTERLAQRAREEENLIIAPGTLFEVKGDEKNGGFRNNVRLCFSWEDKKNIVEGIKRLARVLGRILKDDDDLIHSDTAKIGMAREYKQLQEQELRDSC